MADDVGAAGVDVGATTPMPPGPLLTIVEGDLSVDIAPEAGGRIAQIRCDGVEQLVGHGEHGAGTAIGWGCFPMVPWCGRLRHGQFVFEGRRYLVPTNLGGHAIHGVGFVMPWQVIEHSASHVSLELALPTDRRWPFGGIAGQRIEIDGRQLVLVLSVTAVEHAMPVSMGWHPWFRKPERLDFHPQAMYPRDAEGIAVQPPSEVRPRPWDDCFVNDREVVLHRQGQRLRVASECRDWVVYDEVAYATCVEPQTAPPDAFNLLPELDLRPGETLTARCTLRWE